MARTLKRFSIHCISFHHLKSTIFINVCSAAQILGVHTQRGFGHASLFLRKQTLYDQGASQSLFTPGSAHTDELALGLPVFMDSGGFAALFQGARLEPTGSTVDLVHPDQEGNERTLSPGEVLEFQERHADVGFTLDFPIPQGMDPAEADTRRRATITNARWAIENRRSRTLKLFASLQGLDPAGYGAAAAELAPLPFDGFAIGGLVPRAQDEDLILEILGAIRAAIGEDRPLHAFGMGKPEMVSRLFREGVTSVDSSSYVKAAASGISWAGRPPVSGPKRP